MIILFSDISILHQHFLLNSPVVMIRIIEEWVNAVVINTRIEVIFNQVIMSTVDSGRQIYHGGGFIL